MNTEDFSGVSDEELRKTIKILQAEEQRRADDKLDVRRELNRRFHGKLIEVWPMISDMFEHERTSCSDENPCNGGQRPRCVKCRLIEIMKMDHFEAEDIVIELTARFHKLEDG